MTRNKATGAAGEWRHKASHQLRFRTEHAETTAQTVANAGARAAGVKSATRLYRADQLDADGVGGDDGADWPRVPIDGR